MIKYALVCASGHEFESWFPSSSGFEEQARRGFVTCPDCGAARVERAIMAPNVARTDRGARIVEAKADETKADERPTASTPEAAAPAAPAPVALLGEREIALRQMLAAMHAHVKAHAEPVGDRFAEEALKIHHGESDSRAIYGEATPEDAAMLREEGVSFLPLPRLPGAGN